MSNSYTEGCAEFDIGAQGNNLLVSLHAEVLKMEECGKGWRSMVPRPSSIARRFYVGLKDDVDKRLISEGTVELLEDGVRLYGDEQFPDDYFIALVRFVLKELKLPNVVGWECSVRCDRILPGEFGGFITCVSARGLHKKGTGMLLIESKEQLTDSMTRYLTEGGEL